MSNGYQKRLFRTPALIEPIRYCAWSMPKQRGKLCDTSSDAVYTEHGIVPRVSGLLNRAFPPAVLWLIISIIIYSSDAGSDWFLPHVRKELRVFQPPLADRNSPASVIGITRVFRIKASLDYAFPTPVGWRMDGSWGVTVLRASPYRGQHNSTATGSTFTIPNVFFPDSFFISTITDTKYGFSFGVGFNKRFGFPDHLELSKPLSDQRYCIRHGIAFFNVVFSGGRPASTGAHCEYAGKPLTLQV